jgi:hypothetical protein
MFESIKGLSGGCHNNCKIIYKFWRWRIVKQDESDGNLEFTMTIGLGGRSSSHWKINKRKFWQWKGIW